MIKIDNNDDYDNHNLLELAKIGHFGDFELNIFSGEDKIPHFHMYRGSFKNPIQHAVRLDEPKYFRHPHDNLTLNSKEKKELLDFMNGISKNGRDTNWIFILTTWNYNNEDNELSLDLEIPDYMNL